MICVKKIAIEAPPAAVWEVLSNLGDWPTWVPTVEDVQPRLDAPVEGATVTVKQPRRGPVTYTVAEVQPGRRFRWENSGLGVLQWADHIVTPRTDGTSEVELSFAMTGAIGTVLSALASRRISSMVDAEAVALKYRVEQGRPISG